MQSYIPVDTQYGILFNQTDPDQDPVISIILIEEAKIKGYPIGIVGKQVEEGEDPYQLNMEILLSAIVVDPLYTKMSVKEKEAFLTKTDEVVDKIFQDMKTYIENIDRDQYEKAIIPLDDDYYIDFRYSVEKHHIFSEVKPGIGSYTEEEVDALIDNLPPLEENLVEQIVKNMNSLSRIPEEDKEKVKVMCKDNLPLAFRLARLNKRTFVSLSENVIFVIEYSLLYPKEIKYMIGTRPVKAKNLPFIEDPHEVDIGILTKRLPQNHLDQYMEFINTKMDLAKLAEAGIDGDELKVVKDRLEVYIPSVLQRTLKTK